MFAGHFNNLMWSKLNVCSGYSQLHRTKRPTFKPRAFCYKQIYTAGAGFVAVS